MKLIRNERCAAGPRRASSALFALALALYGCDDAAQPIFGSPTDLGGAGGGGADARTGDGAVGTDASENDASERDASGSGGGAADAEFDAVAADAGFDAAGAGPDTTPRFDAAGGGPAPDAAAAPDAAPPSIEGPLYEAYCEPLSRHICEEAVECDCPTPGDVPLDVETCVREEVERCLFPFLPLEEDLLAGDLVVVEEIVDVCVTALIQQSGACRLVDDRIANTVCGSIIASPAAVGARCQGDFCARGEGLCVNGICEAMPAVDEPCARWCANESLCIDGTCRVPAGEGAPCAGNGVCRAPLRCVQGECQPLRAAGVACAVDDQCDVALVCNAGICEPPMIGDCAAGQSCGNLAQCFGSSDQVCQPHRPEGEPCQRSEECASGLYCPVGGLSGCTLAPAIGQPCADGVVCGPGAACSIELGTCVAAPGAGQPCGVGASGPVLCSGALVCVQDVCGPLPGVDERCAAGNVCAAGLGCALTAEGGFCSPRAADGEPCAGEATCGDGLYCDFGESVCEPIVDLGEPCAFAAQCGAHASCQLTEDGQTRCRALPANGERCFGICADDQICAHNPRSAVCGAPICGVTGI